MPAPSDETRPRPPGPDGETAPTPPGPHPLQRPDERKEGGPDFGKTERQEEKRDQAAEDVERDQHPRIKRPLP